MLMYMLELYINIDAHPAVGDYVFNIILTMLMAFLHSVHYVDGYVTMLMAKYLRKSSGRTPTPSGFRSHLVGIVNPAPRCEEKARKPDPDPRPNPNPRPSLKPNPAGRVLVGG